MTNWNPSEQLTTNFSLKEFMQGVALPLTAVKWNWEDLTEKEYENIKKIAVEVQNLRDKVNLKFRGKDNKDIGLRITAGFRTKRWELHQKRSGNSMHVPAIAADFFPVNCVDDKQYIEIVNWIMHEYRNWNGGLAIKDYQLKKDKNKKDIPDQIEKYGFIHLDLGTKRRWKY
jgi:hypothetical protein